MTTHKSATQSGEKERNNNSFAFFYNIQGDKWVNANLPHSCSAFQVKRFKCCGGGSDSPKYKTRE